MPRQHQHRLFYGAIAFVVLLICGVLAIPPQATQAIGEVTPTPAVAPDLSFEEYVQLGITALQNRDYQTAIENFDRALALQQDPDVLTFRAFSQAQLGNYDAAIADYEQVLDIRLWDWTVLGNLGFIYMELNDYNRALDYFNQTIYRNPRDQAVYLYLSEFYNRRDDPAEATAMDWIARGLDRISFADNATAVEYFSNAIREINAIEGGVLTPEQESAAYYNRALAYHNQEDWENALADYTAALQIFPDMHDALLARGIVYRETEDIVNAGVDFLKRIQLLQINAFTEDAITFGESIEIEMTYGNVYNIPFTGEEGQTIIIEADDADFSGVDPLIVLLDQDGNPIAGDDDFGGNLDSEIADFILPYSGDYTIVVSHANGGFDGLVRVALDDFVSPGSF